MVMDRRNFFRAAAAGLVFPTAAVSQSQRPPRPPALPVELVREFVGAGHGDLDKVKSMLAAEPGLLNATYDWSNGDFETSIGGAGHMGRADIAEFLIKQGARADIFVYAMLGDKAIVTAILDRNPNLIESRGPHEISLLRHAEMGKERAVGVLELLKSRGAKD